MDEHQNDFIGYRIIKSKEIFDDALLLADNNRWNSCINRLYYSSFYLVSALLAKNGINADTHSGAKTLFFLHFVKSEILTKDLGKLYANLFNWRHETDYADFIEFTKEVVEPLIEQVRQLNAILSDLIENN